MKYLFIFLSVLFLFSCEEEEDFSEPFYLDENGVTIKAKDWVTVGTTGELNGITYLAVDDSLLAIKDFMLQYPEIGGAEQLVFTLVTYMGVDVIGSQFMWPFYNNTISTKAWRSMKTWDVSNVTNMAGLFGTCNCFNPADPNNKDGIPDLTYWDVSSVTNMRNMFSHIYGAAMFNQDISGWDVSNVTDMTRMFMGNQYFNQDLSGWDVSKVTNCDGFYTEFISTWTQQPNFLIDCN